MCADRDAHCREEFLLARWLPATWFSEVGTSLTSFRAGRIKESQQKRVLDEAARKRRQRKALEALESDNFQDDPHADLKMSKKAPKFEESIGEPTNMKKKRKSKGEFKQRYRKNFAALLEEEQQVHSEPPNYFSAAVPPSVIPPRHFCAVCGFPSNFTCVQCGARYCCIRCLGTHQDTRCLKYTA
ncbi:zinc finger HIT domain-containing protein 1 [Patella vulgata]|uniref:zinc finger HIT domain-containing protein 1 n=1 Tax=Patella vulgata TaxID=6465 RepID=UPI00218010E5|nr:zinc finger HIT domain-containing protein 1 [Patella vulgata]